MTEEFKKRLQIKVEGQVQGVGYRFFAQRTACTLGIKGHVRNNPDGTVSIEAEGEPGQVERFMEYVEKGPQWARVDQVSASEIPATGEKGFSVE
jgi:acylphosphatase